MSAQEIFLKQSIFTLDDLRASLDKEHSRNQRSREAFVSYHLKHGHLIRVRRGVFAVVPPGGEPETCSVDPYLVAAKSAADAVLAYHTALDVQGKAHALFERYFFLSGTPLRPTKFRNYRFQGVLCPKALREKGQEHFATTIVDRAGTGVRVTTLERTLVDLLDRPDLGGGWEEIWRSLESVEYFDLDQVIEYVKLLDNRTTAAKTGYYLQQHADALMVDPGHLDPLRKLRPSQPHYLERGKGGQFNRDWNLIIPKRLADRSWEQVT
ncbi:MAG: transcriptional regulator [Lentisphaerae bacterium RIFOXYB12_FULL_60_10]|nr:MAG: transcriptional regulator [Lentisphaerae bacterium RIFOXYB12_FULL_60_10]